MTIKALILDADGVLTQPLMFQRYLEREYPAIAAQTVEFFTTDFRQCIVGQADMRAVLPQFLDKWHWPHGLDDFIDRWFEEEKTVDERLVETVTQIRAAGTPCYVATNQEKYRLHYMRTAMRFDALFDGLFGSAEIGHRKPAAEFYRAVEAQVGVPGEQIMFWDDTQKNVDGARACGWQAELYENFEDFTKAMSL